MNMDTAVAAIITLALVAVMLGFIVTLTVDMIRDAAAAATEWRLFQIATCRGA